jgi:hypothetical protein
MKILPNQLHNILKIYRANTKKKDPAENVSKNPNGSSAADAKPANHLQSDQVNVSESGKKEQVKKEILSGIMKKIRNLS